MMKANDDRLLIDIYRWLWCIEADLQNDYVNKLNLFVKRRSHSFYDYLSIYESELKMKHFKEFSRDISKIISNR